LSNVPMVLSIDPRGCRLIKYCAFLFASTLTQVPFHLTVADLRATSDWPPTALSTHEGRLRHQEAGLILLRHLLVTTFPDPGLMSSL
jgi:hypothetical protein